MPRTRGGWLAVALALTTFSAGAGPSMIGCRETPRAAASNPTPGASGAAPQAACSPEGSAQGPLLVRPDGAGLEVR